MAKRPSYKALYLAEQGRSSELKSQLSVTRHRLSEINRALAPFGRYTLESFTPSDLKLVNAIHLAPHEFVAVRAFFEGDARFNFDQAHETILPVNYTWRGIPILSNL